MKGLYSLYQNSVQHIYFKSNERHAIFLALKQ